MATGYGSSLLIGEEADWGTAVSPTHRARVSSMSLKQTRNREPRPHLGDGAASTAHRTYYTASIEAGGALDVPLYYDDPALMILLAHAMGKVSTSGSGPYVHTATPTGPGNSSGLEGLTLVQGYGSHDIETFDGCLIGGLELTVEAGQPVRVNFPDVLARASSGLDAPTPGPAFALDAEAVDFEDFGQISWNGLTFTPRSVTIRVTRPWERQNKVGSLHTSRPVQTDRITIEITATVDHVEADMADADAAWRADTAADWSLGATGTGGNALSITGHNAEIADIARDVSGPGVIESQITWRCKADSTKPGLALALTNALATYNAIISP